MSEERTEAEVVASINRLLERRKRFLLRCWFGFCVRLWIVLSIAWALVVLTWILEGNK